MGQVAPACPNKRVSNVGCCVRCMLCALHVVCAAGRYVYLLPRAHNGVAQGLLPFHPPPLAGGMRYIYHAEQLSGMHPWAVMQAL